MVTLWSRKCERANMSMKPKTHKTLKVCLLDLNQLTELVHLIFQGTPHSSWWPLKQKIYISSLSFPQLQLWNPVISSIAPLYLAQGSRTVSMMSWWRLSVAKSIIRWKSTSRPAKFDIKRQKVAIWRQYKENWNFTLFGDKTNKPLSFLDCKNCFQSSSFFFLLFCQDTGDLVILYFSTIVLLSVVHSVSVSIRLLQSSTQANLSWIVKVK